MIVFMLALLLDFQPHTVTRRDGTKLEAEMAKLRRPPFELAVMRLRSTSAAPGDPIVWLAGGPGNAATSMATSPAVAHLRTLGDVLLMDQRGTGMSEPVPRCATPAPPPDVYFADPAATLAGATAAVRECAADWKKRGIDVSAFRTEEAADDVEALRVAIGAPKIRLIGFSYGTHLGLSVLRRHGQHVSRAVLIGTEGPDETFKLPETFEMQLHRLSRLAGGDDALVRAFDRVAAKLEKTPIEVEVRLRDDQPPVSVRVSRYGFERILAEDLGDSNDFVLFPAMFAMLEQGDTTLFARYVQKRFRPVTRGMRLMPIATDCASSASPERLATIARQEKTARFRYANFPFPGICAAFPSIALGDHFRAPVISDVPTLFVSGTLDVNTPPYQAERAAWGFSDARHLVLVNAGHEDMDSHPKAGAVMLDFLAGKEVKSGTIELPRPRFLSVEGARDRVP